MMKNDPEPNAAAPREKKSAPGAVLAGIAAAVLGISELAVYIVYAALSGSSYGKAGMLMLPMQLLFIVCVAAGIYALCRRRWIGGLIGLICPFLLPLFDLIVRLAR